MRTDPAPDRPAPRRRRALAAAAVVVGLAAATAVTLAVTSDGAADGSGTTLGLVPMPVSLEQDGGDPFVLEPTTRVVTVVDADVAGDVRAAVTGVGETLGEQLAPATGFDLARADGPSAAVDGDAGDGDTVEVSADDLDVVPGSITLRLVGDAAGWDPNGPLTDPAAERYALAATSDGVTIEAATPAGLFRGTQTLLQLLPAPVAATSEQPAPAGGWTVPAVRVEDQPRYAYRAVGLDVARRFYPVEDVLRLIDQAASYKFDVLRLHLADDQGWRIAIDGMPELTEIGARTQSGFAPGTNDTGEDWYYTAEDYARIVDHAARRFVTVVPEIDGPGHTLAAQSAIGALRCDGTPAEPYSGFDVGNPMICSSDENMPAVRDYLHGVVTALADMTPGPYLHLGGDEVPDPPDGWYENYTEAANAEVVAAGKTVIGWHEWAQSETLPPGTLVEYWGVGGRNRAGIGTQVETDEVGYMRDAVDKGADVVMMPPDRTYLDMRYDDWSTYGLQWAGFVDLEQAYDWDPATELTSPLDDSLVAVPADRVVGVEAALWSDRTYQNGVLALPDSTDDFVPVQQYMDYLLYPRLPAVAEVAWTPQAQRDYATFVPRLVQHAARWDAQQIGWNRVTDVDWP
ncbi:beta-N-acetylhexosaminidase [Sediminihabitans luteus]|uniref:beta-N-acetylhexosaminidase n=1 Tax=Sediminihabitans luteus TaxID=1138585 RepID=UPI0012FD9709|nr:family 20 glycosylhydrolase [Sediminihabitans luteus]